jgi:hypothetical protein
MNSFEPLSSDLQRASGPKRAWRNAYPFYILLSIIVLPLLTGGLLMSLGLFAQFFPLILGLITLCGLLTILIVGVNGFVSYYRGLTPKSRSDLHRLILRRFLLLLALLSGILGPPSSPIGLLSAAVYS